VKPGDLHWVELPATSGHEQAGRRPALILQDDTLAESLPVVIVVPLTSAVAAARFPGTLRIDANPENGLQKPSVILVFQIRALDRRRLRERIGEIQPDELEKVHQLLQRLTGWRAPSSRVDAG
jgi:mRNA interferase MazF